jgi:hypothetical protein
MADGAASGAWGAGSSRYWGRKQGWLTRPVRQIFLAEDGVHVFDRAGAAVRSLPYEGVLEAGEKPSPLAGPQAGYLRLGLTRGGALAFKMADPVASVRFLSAFKRWGVGRGVWPGGRAGGRRCPRQHVPPSPRCHRLPPHMLSPCERY